MRIFYTAYDRMLSPLVYLYRHHSDVTLADIKCSIDCSTQTKRSIEAYDRKIFHTLDISKCKIVKILPTQHLFHNVITYWS